jgi:apolipoprotein N-acyltransferase
MINSKIQKIKVKILNLKSKFSKTRNPQSAIRNQSSYPPSEGTFSEEDILAAKFRVTKVLPFQQASPPFLNNLWLAVVSGFLLVLALPNWSLWSLGWVGVAPLIMAVAREQKFWRSFWLGLTTGVIFYAGSSPWITYSMNNYGGIPLWLCYILLIIIAVILASFMALFAGVLGYTIKSFGGWAILSAPVLWAASEWLRLQLTGMGWNALGYSQAFQPILIQISRFGGVYLVSAFLVSMSTAIVFSLIYLGYRRGWVVFTIAGLLAVGIMVDGKLRMPFKPSAQPIKVVAVQPSIPIDGNWSDDNFETQMMLRHITLSEEELKELLPGRIQAGEVQLDPPINKPAANAANNSGNLSNGFAASRTLVIWPESPINFHYEKDEVLRSRLTSFTRRHNVYLLLNSWGVPPEGTNVEGITNSALLISPSGELISRYDKIALMPFGEYVPARGWIPFMDKIPALVADIVPGKNFTLQEVAGAKLGTMICFEVTRPEIARRFRNEGASVFVQLSNESWFGPTSAARQVLSQTVFRAVENDIDLIRVTNSGLSAEITSYGEVIDETQMFQPITRSWSVDTVEEVRSKPATFYTRYGDVFAIACTTLGGMFLIVAIVYERLKKKEDEEE